MMTISSFWAKSVGIFATYNVCVLASICTECFVTSDSSVNKISAGKHDLKSEKKSTQWLQCQSKELRQ